MVYQFRRATPADLIGLLDALAPSYGTDPCVHRALPAFWTRMADTGAMVASVSLDATDPRHPFPVASSACLLVDPDLPRQVLRADEGGFGEHAVRRSLAGEPVALSPDDIAAGNRGSGSDVVMLHCAYLAGPCMSENPQEVLECQAAAFIEFHRGIKIRTYHQSCTSADELRWLVGSGLRLRARSRDTLRHRDPTPDRPALVGARSDELPALWGTRAARLFAYYPPRLGLKALHRDLLQPALAGFTDEEIADALCLSLSAVKKRWACLYESIEAACPGLLGDAARTSDPSAGRRAERRRHLLEYVRRHPEELNPQAAR